MSVSASLRRNAWVTVAAMAFCATALAGDKIGIPAAVPFAEDANVPAAVKDECKLGEKISSFVGKYSKGRVELSENAAAGQYVNMSITEVHAPGGGGWSGPKWMEVTGTLQENGKSVASFRAKRFSTGGAFGGFKGTCSIIGRCTKALGKDIAKWIKNPVDGAALGDAK